MKIERAVELLTKRDSRITDLNLKINILKELIYELLYDQWKAKETLYQELYEELKKEYEGFKNERRKTKN